MRRMVAARARGDVEVADSFYSSSEDLWVIGSDEHEWYRGTQEVVPISEAHTREWGTHESELLRVHAFEAGSVGWAALEEKRTFPSGGISVFRWTSVLELEAGSWKIVQSHFSAPVPNLETAGIELTRTLSDLVDSLDVEPGLSTASGLSGTATLMFTDIVDSTPMSMSLGETAWLDAINAHLETLRRIVEAEGGSVVKTLGDGGMYAFASGSSALNAATRIQESVTRSTNPELQVRIGVHTGDVMQTDGDYLGSTVAKAARVAAAAEGGQILVSSTTAGLVSASEFEFGSPITVQLKGLDGTYQLQPLAWS